MNSFLYPTLKPFVEYYSTSGVIYFFHTPGVAVKLKDPSGFIQNVCKLMDGKNSLQDIERTLLATFPNETKYVVKLLSILDKESLLEDCAYNRAEKLTEYESDRWSRNIEFLGAYSKATENKYAYQEKIRNAKVAIFGLGGVGSNILLNLVAMGVTNIRAVDFDKVELSNLNRQIIYDESDIGQFKSDAARNRINKFISDSNIDFINRKIASANDIEEILDGHDVAFLAIDHPREDVIDWFNAACISKRVPFICGSLDSRFVTFYSILPCETGCVECWRNNKTNDEFIFQDIIQQNGFVPAKSPNTAIMPLISLLSGFVTSEFLKMITGIAEMHSSGRLCAYDFMSSEIKVIDKWERDPSCLACSVE